MIHAIENWLATNFPTEDSFRWFMFWVGAVLAPCILMPIFVIGFNEEHFDEKTQLQRFAHPGYVFILLFALCFFGFLGGFANAALMGMPVMLLGGAVLLFVAFAIASLPIVGIAKLAQKVSG